MENLENAEILVRDHVYFCASGIFSASFASLCEVLGANESELLSLFSSSEDDENRRESLEFWLVSEYLAQALDTHGENVLLDSYLGPIWGRCTSGQAIDQDEVIRLIAE